MNPIFFVLLLICCMQSSVLAQETSPKNIDSIYSLEIKAYKLTQQNKIADAMLIGYELLQYGSTENNDSIEAAGYKILGISYSILKDSAKSYKYFKKNRDINLRLKDTSKLINSYNNLGVISMTLSNNVKKSNAYFKRAAKLAYLSGNYDEAIHPNANIASNLINGEKESNIKDQYNLAIGHFNEALSLLEKTNNKRYRRVKADVYEALGVVYFKLGDVKQGDVFFEKALVYSKDNGYVDVIRNVYRDKAKLYEERKDYKKQTEMLNLLIKIKDSIYTLENSENAKRVESEFFIKEQEEKLRTSENQKAVQQSIIAKTKIYNSILTGLSILLLLGVYLIFRKNRQLKLSKDRAENLYRVKSDFYSEISHELRTPLYAVIELSNLLLKDNVNSKQKEYIETLKFSGNHLLSLINNVLELNQVEFGSMKIQVQEFNLKELIHNIIESLGYGLNESNNKIHLNFDKAIPNRIVGDALKLSQVLINLVSNAIKFTNNGSIDIIIKLLEETTDTIVVYFEIADDGVGISKKKQTQVFEDFYQEVNKIKESCKGTGLGLSIVKRILVAMDSEIEVVSEGQGGAAFFFELTFNKNNDIKRAMPEYNSQLENIKNHYILIVDDNKVNQLVTKKVLDNIGVKTKVVGSGREAIKIVKNESFDCILMDLHMPELDGYETSKIIRTQNERIAIVALTAANSEEVKTKIGDYGIDDYVLKPFIMNEFINVITKAVYEKTPINEPTI